MPCFMGDGMDNFSRSFSLCDLSLVFRYMAQPSQQYDSYGGYPMAPLPMPLSPPIPAPSSYVPVQVSSGIYVLYNEDTRDHPSFYC